MKQGIYEVMSNRPIAQSTYEMVLSGDGSGLVNPGQFVNIKLDGLYLRRPISVCDWKKDSITIIYKVVGRGTGQMAGLQPGAKLDLLTGLGNGFDTSRATGHSLAVGGGVGVPPLYGLCKALVAQGKQVTAVLGFANKEQAFYQKELAQLGIEVLVATEDGSLGQKGFVTHVMESLAYDYYFACGPMPMLKALHALGKPGQLSFEERMGCGFGACMGCSCETLVGSKRICVDGPVMLSSEVKF